MAKTTDLSFDGGAIVAPGGETTSAQVHTVFLHEITITDAGQESHIYALFDKNRPTASAPFFEPVSSFNLAEWCIRGDAVQVDLSEVMDSGTDRYSGLLQDLTLTNDQTSGMYVRECTLRTMVKQGTTGVRFAWFSLYLVMDQDTSITYLATPVYNNPATLDVPDHKVQVEQTDNPNYLAYKIMGDGSTVNVDVVRENALGQPIDPFLRISALVSSSTDVIKWSDVLAVEDDDYSEFTARINSDIASGIAPVILDDVNDGAVAVLDNINAGGALFRTSTNCDERDVIFTNYVITDVSVSRTTRMRNVLFKNASNAYGTDADGFVEVGNNRNGVYTYSGNTGGNSLDFLADFDNVMAVPSIRFSDVNPPNFAVKIVSTAATDGTVTVYKKQNGIYTPLMPSVAGGTTVEAGKTYQLTCVGDCWTLAEFEEPVQGLSMSIGGKRYKVVRIGNLYWMAENLDYAWNGLNFPANSISTTEPDANYYNGALTGSYGLLYSGTARDYMISHASELGFGAWRIPSSNDFIDLMDAVGLETSGTKLRATSVWSDGGGTDDYGFNAYPTGAMHGEGALMGQPAYTYDEETTRTGFWTSDNSGDYYVRLGLQSGVDVAALGNQNKYNGHNVRLCMDA